MDMQKIRAAADAVRGDFDPNFGAYMVRDRKALELICLELKAEPSELNLAQIGALLDLKKVSLIEEYPKMMYRGSETQVVDSEAEEKALPTDGGAWSDLPPGAKPPEATGAKAKAPTPAAEPKKASA